VSASGPVVAVLDYGMGNLRSVEKALEHVGAGAEITADHERIRAADGLILPGVGAFPEAMGAVRERALDELLHERVGAGVPTLGICLGMQLLFEWSPEHGGAEGIGLLKGTVEALPAAGLKLPQIGWNTVTWRRGSRLLDGLPERCAFYHVHTYSPAPAEQSDVLGTAVYGSVFVSAVDRDPVFGAQFHPEKSGEHGLRLLAGFAALCRP
jgi:imidazole glycerol-phosphate synthase subunit HisH